MLNSTRTPDYDAQQDQVNRPAATDVREQEGRYRRVRLNAWLGRTIAREHATNAARWICNVAGIPRNEMNVDVHAGLACSATNIYSNVVTVRRMLRLYEFTRTVEECNHGHLLKVRHFEEVSNMPPRYDDDMAGT